MPALLHFQLSSKAFAISVDRVREILRMPALTELPDGSLTRRGLLDLRGMVIPVYDVRPVLALPAGPLGWELRTDQYVLILQCLGDAREVRADAGIVADDVHGVLSVLPSDLSPVQMAEVDNPVYQTVARFGPALLTVLSVEGMVRAARVHGLGRGAA